MLEKYLYATLLKQNFLSLFKTYEDPETFALDVGTTMSDVSIGTQTAVVTIADDDCKLLNC